MFHPSFTSLSEVVSHLNATGPDDNSNYTVYGLTVSEGTMQAHVDHANKYLASLVPSLTGPGSTDPRESSAELAALDIACLGVLVTVVGGSLVGAYDYVLGDLRVTRGTPYAFAIKTAIDGYSRSAAANLQNVTAVAKIKTANLASQVPQRRPLIID